MMTNSLNQNQQRHGKVSAVPTLLTVPDLRHPLHESGQSTAAGTGASTETDNTVASPSESTSHTIPSMEDLLEAATAPVPADTPQNDVPSPKSLPETKSRSYDRWFAGDFRLDMSTIGTIAATVIACTLVAQGMRPTQTRDNFAGALISETQNSATEAVEDVTIEMAQVPENSFADQGSDTAELGIPNQPGQIQTGRFDTDSNQQSLDPGRFAQRPAAVSTPAAASIRQPTPAAPNASTPRPTLSRGQGAYRQADPSHLPAQNSAQPQPAPSPNGPGPLLFAPNSPSQTNTTAPNAPGWPSLDSTTSLPQQNPQPSQVIPRNMQPYTTAATPSSTRYDYPRTAIQSIDPVVSELRSLAQRGAGLRVANQGGVSAPAGSGHASESSGNTMNYSAGAVR